MYICRLAVGKEAYKPDLAIYLVVRAHLERKLLLYFFTKSGAGTLLVPCIPQNLQEAVDLLNSVDNRVINIDAYPEVTNCRGQHIGAQVQLKTRSWFVVCVSSDYCGLAIVIHCGILHSLLATSYSEM